MTAPALPLRRESLIIDGFAGGGGASLGIEMALGRSPDIAINHDPEAVAMHAANHPRTRHLSTATPLRGWQKSASKGPRSRIKSTSPRRFYLAHARLRDRLIGVGARWPPRKEDTKMGYGIGTVGADDGYQGATEIAIDEIVALEFQAADLEDQAQNAEDREQLGRASAFRAKRRALLVRIDELRAGRTEVQS